MDILNFTFRLLKHGSIFLLKLVGIGLGVADDVLGRTKDDSADVYGYNFPDHSYPDVSDVNHPDWVATYGHRK